MLIDATHKEEIRVAVTDGNRLIEYDYESQSRKPLKGSIFLAKVTRVEPSLQAAFVNFGGNRHGFLPFSEIHPDYFKIPVADRDALMAEQEALLREHDKEEELEENSESEGDLSEDAAVDDEPVSEPEEVGGSLDVIDEEAGKKPGKDKEDKTKEELVVKEEAKESGKVKAAAKKPAKAAKKSDEIIVSKEVADGNTSPENEEEIAKNDKDGNVKSGNTGDALEGDGSDGQNKNGDDNNKGARRGGYRGQRRGRGGRGGGKRSQYRNRNVEVVGGDEMDVDQRFRFNLRRKYKIQEVIKRGQIMLVQANKEERGNKGAAVGSYLSLPGRYCVLMPNSPRAGGVSRKIANSKDRARMRDIVKSLEVPKGMSVIMRTAGVTRTKAEIKRDLDYLMRLWDQIRELTLESSAPSLVYEEADLIKRSIRDLYTRDIEEIYVAGTDGYESAKEFMKMMIPSHVKKVKQYKGEKLPLFNRYQIEGQINEIGQPEVRLKSGGYLVINPTEALVSVDVNSGKSTKGRHIEETALKTNLEAADEVARQLKLRDLGGLVVIDFIDMEHRGNNAKVERRMKEALSTDRARVQVGRISSFGLMELSRQRLSPSLMEAQFEQCNKCSGIGLVRTSDAMSILVLRAIEDEGIRGRAAQIIVQVTGDVALYILNHKRKKLAQIEERYGLEVLLRVDDEIPASEYRVEVSKPAESGSVEEAPESPEASGDDASEDGSSKDNTRRRGRRGGRGGNKRQESGNVEGNVSKETPDVAVVDNVGSGDAKSMPANDDGEKADKSEEKGDEKPVKKVARKKAPSVKPAKKDDEKPAAKIAVVASNEKLADKKVDEKSSESKEEKQPEPKEEGPSEASQHETVNQAPKQKKKGWWNRL